MTLAPWLSARPLRPRNEPPVVGPVMGPAVMFQLLGLWPLGCISQSAPTVPTLSDCVCAVVLRRGAGVRTRTE